MVTPLFLTLLPLLLGAAPQGNPPAPPGPPPGPAATGAQTDLRRPRWEPRQEDRDWLEALALADLEALRQRHCSQALLNPPALEDDPTEAYLEFARARQEPLKSCHDRMVASLDALVGDKQGPEQARIIARVAEACEGAAALLTELNRHPRLCSPFQVGLAQGGELRRLAAVIGGLGLRTRYLAQTGAPREALKLGLELALLSQNLGHGWAGLHQAVMAAEQWLVSAHPWTALALSDQQVDAELLKQFIVSSSELLSHEPSLGQMLVADQAWFLVTSILPSFFGPQWRPRLPGQGAPGDERPMPNRPPPGSQFTHPSQVLFFFLGMRVKSARVLEVCGGQASPVACLELLVRHTSVEREMASQQELWPRVKLGLEEFGAVGALFLALGLEGNPPRGPSLETMLYRFLARRGALAMLRLEAAVRLHALRFQGPPDEAAMRAEAWRPLLVDEVFGGVYTIQVKDDLVTVKPGSLPAGLTPEQASWFFHDFTLEGPRSPGDTPLPSLPGGPRP